MFQPKMLPARLGLLALGLAISLIGPPGAPASTVVVPDDSSTVQAGIDSYADTILVRAGTYPESVLVLPQFKPVVLLADPAASPRPTLDYLKVWANNSHNGNIKVVGLRIIDPVVIWSHSVSAHYDFESCTFDAGLGHGGVWVDPDHAGAGTSLIRCMIRGGVALTTGYLTVDSDTVEAGGASFMTQQAEVRNCWFRGPAGFGLSHRSPMYGVIYGNVFEDCATGIDVYDDLNSSFFSIQNNVIRRSQGWGIWMRHGEYVDILGNDVRDSGGGIKANVDGNTGFRVIGNNVIGCRGNGMDLDNGDFDIEVRNNTVLRCRGSGIRVQGLDYGSTASRVIRSNTCALNEGPGFDIAIDNQFIQPIRMVVSNNVSYGNGSWGLRWTSNDTPTLGCNDWFSNTAGAVSGTAAGVTDMSVDPLFCDISLDDAHLRSDSPLVDAAGCGLIGALGIGCGETPTLVQRFNASRVSGGIEIVWQVTDGATASAVWVERAESETGGWTRPVTVRSFVNTVMVELDGSAASDRTYWYRLVAQEGSATEVIGAPVEVRAGARLGFRLTEVGPSPGSGPVRIGFALPRAADIQISVFDVQGRRVATLASGAWPAGAHEVEWNGRTSGAPAPAGLYVLSYRYPGGIDKRAVVRVR